MQDLLPQIQPVVVVIREVEEGELAEQEVELEPAALLGAVDEAAVAPEVVAGGQGLVAVQRALGAPRRQTISASESGGVGRRYAHLVAAVFGAGGA